MIFVKNVFNIFFVLIFFVRVINNIINVNIVWILICVVLFINFCKNDIFLNWIFKIYEIVVKIINIFINYIVLLFWLLIVL